jgi:hypothetical protein
MDDYLSKPSDRASPEPRASSPGAAPTVDRAPALELLLEAVGGDMELLRGQALLSRRRFCSRRWRCVAGGDLLATPPRAIQSVTPFLHPTTSSTSPSGSNRTPRCAAPRARIDRLLSAVSASGVVYKYVSDADFS